MTFNLKEQGATALTARIFSALPNGKILTIRKFTDDLYECYKYQIHHDLIKGLKLSKNFRDDWVFLIYIEDMVWGHRVDEYLMKWDETTRKFNPHVNIRFT